jgi:hypothetical protein
MEYKFDKTIEDLIMSYPNDYDLGTKIREIYNQSRKLKTDKDGVQQEDTQKG